MAPAIRKPAYRILGRYYIGRDAKQYPPPNGLLPSQPRASMHPPGRRQTAVRCSDPRSFLDINSLRRRLVRHAPWLSVCCELRLLRPHSHIPLRHARLCETAGPIYTTKRVPLCVYRLSRSRMSLIACLYTHILDTWGKLQPMLDALDSCDYVMFLDSDACE